MYEDLSQRQIEILLYIKKFLDFYGYPPTVREIAKEINIKSTSTVHSDLEKLSIKNYIKRNPLKTRAIEILNYNDELIPSKKTIDVPIVGLVTAGAPILAVENIEDTFPLPIEFVKSKNLFILKVKGDSMINAGILNGDYVIIQKQNYASNGDKVLALIEDSATIKTFYKEKEIFRLQPENDLMEPIYLKELEIIGIIVGLYRKY